MTESLALLALLLAGCAVGVEQLPRGVNDCISNLECGCGYYCNWRDRCVPVKQDATWCP